MTDPMPVRVDETDPLVMLLAWGLTYAVGRYGAEWLRPYLPAVSVLAAVALRTGIAAVEGEPLTVEVLLRAIAAGSAAVMAHSQTREIVKRAAPSETPGP